MRWSERQRARPRYPSTSTRSDSCAAAGPGHRSSRTSTTAHYDVEASGQPLHPSFPGLGDAPYSIGLAATVRRRDLLGHLDVLIPVLDDKKHYWVDKAEIDKLLRRGEGRLLAELAKDHSFTEIVGEDVSGPVA